MTIETSVACPVRPLVDTSWLALPLSARGLVDELSKYTDDNARIILRLDDRADADAVGKEIARLLCAHPGELARVRRDTQKLLEGGVLAVDGSALRLSRIAHETARSVVERPRPMTPGERQQLCRDREKALREQAPESSRNVTAERDDLRDERHVASVTRPLSFKKDLDLKDLKEREGVTPIVTTKRDAVPEELNQARRAKAKQLGLADHRIDFVWRQFATYHRRNKKAQQAWDDLWEAWVSRRLVWDSEKAPGSKTIVQAADLDAPWIREAMGEK